MLAPRGGSLPTLSYRMVERRPLAALRFSSSGDLSFRASPPRPASVISGAPPNSGMPVNIPPAPAGTNLGIADSAAARRISGAAVVHPCGTDKPLSEPDWPTPADTGAAARPADAATGTKPNGSAAAAAAGAAAPRPRGDGSAAPAVKYSGKKAAMMALSKRASWGRAHRPASDPKPSRPGLGVDVVAA